MAAPESRKRTAEKFENDILPELEIVIMPYKHKGKVRLEIMDDEFVMFAKEEGIIDNDLIDNITWRKAGIILGSLVDKAQEFYVWKEKKNV